MARPPLRSSICAIALSGFARCLDSGQPRRAVGMRADDGQSRRRDRTTPCSTPTSRHSCAARSAAYSLTTPPRSRRMPATPRRSCGRCHCTRCQPQRARASASAAASGTWPLCRSQTLVNAPAVMSNLPSLCANQRGREVEQVGRFVVHFHAVAGVGAGADHGYQAVVAIVRVFSIRRSTSACTAAAARAALVASVSSCNAHGQPMALKRY